MWMAVIYMWHDFNRMQMFIVSIINYDIFYVFQNMFHAYDSAIQNILINKQHFCMACILMP